MAAHVMASKDREVNLILILILINSVCVCPLFLDNHWTDLIETCQVHCWGPVYVPFQGLILIGQVLPKSWPFIYQPMKGHVAALAWLCRPVRGRPTMTSRAVPVTMGIGALVTVA